MFGKKKKQTEIIYNPDTMKPVLHCSICNGEQVFGFKDTASGEFIEVSLIRNTEELEKYKVLYGIDHIVKEY